MTGEEQLTKAGLWELFLSDFKKALDSVPHTLLLRSNLLGLEKQTNFLAGCLQRVLIDGISSDWLVANQVWCISGISLDKGRVVGVIFLFSLYINDLPSVLETLSVNI